MCVLLYRVPGTVSNNGMIQPGSFGCDVLASYSVVSLPGGGTLQIQVIEGRKQILILRPAPLHFLPHIIEPTAPPARPALHTRPV